MALARMTLQVEGMSCASCSARIERALLAVHRVQVANVNLITEQVEVFFLFVGSADTHEVLKAIAQAGYTVREQTSSLLIEKMTCASCVGRVEKVLLRLPGVLEARVNLMTERAEVRYAAGSQSIDDLITAVGQAGFVGKNAGENAAKRALPSGDNEALEIPSLADQSQARRAREERALYRAFWVAAALSLPIFGIEMGGHVVPALHDWVMHVLGQQTSWLIQFVLTTLVLCGPGWRFFRQGVPALLRFAPDMNSLVALGTMAAYGYSAVATFFPSVLPPAAINVYYEAAALIVTLILLGRTLEARAKGRTSQAIKRLLGLQPKTARVQRGEHTESQEVALDQVHTGDMVLVRPGEKIPLDGQVIAGSSYVDESMISGEALPVLKEKDAEVIGGTVNKNGAFSFRVSKIGADTLLAQIIRLVEDAQAAKLPIQALVDKVTLYFVPAVMGAAALTFFVWLNFGPAPALSFALVNAVAVLIIACPCAMGLATPTSIMVGTGRAAELGILFRQGDALQALREVSIVALDKTGTLTQGKPALTDFVLADGLERNEVLARVAALETYSEHPIGQALVEAAKAQNLSLAVVSDFVAKPGFGVSGVVDGQRVYVGADRFMLELGLDISPFAARAQRLGEQGKSPLYAAIGQRLAAIIAVADPIKATTPAAIDALHALGLKVAMITGDNAATAAAVAQELGIDEFVAEVLPEGKIAALKQLRAHAQAARQAGEKTSQQAVRIRIAFVGDGINDAPALAEADVGLAIGTGTDVAIEAASVVLMSGDLRGVINAIAISKATMRNIQQNLFWAFAYNVLLIPVAAGLLYPINGWLLSPIFAAAAMTLSSVFVLGNALRLKAWQAVL